MTIISTTICEWTYDNDEGLWHSSCGDLFVFNEGTPIENGFHWCPYCGKRLLDKEGSTKE